MRPQPLVWTGGVRRRLSQSEQRTGDAAPVDNLEDAQKAVIQIEAVGTFKDIEEGLTTAAGLGSGFIIDADGRAVTNNHVVTGAAFLKVYVDGKEEPINAKVLGVSECADLAVIDLDGKNYPYLGWYEPPIKVGLEVYAAGFPLGDPEYTLTKGIVSKARTSGESDWSSVDHVIQHDAVIDHGNSGGPLITNKGEVVAVNYAGIMDSNQFYSIAAANAQAVIEQLLTGADVDSIGVNAQAFLDEENQISGIWVASVASGSPADKAGLLPGDFITSLEGLALAEDGTMATYCEILRSHDATDTLNLEVVRLDTNEVLTGQLNGRELKHSADLQTAPATDDNGTEQASTADWVTIKDDLDRVNVDVPEAWGDVEQKDWERGDAVVGAQLVASTDLASFYDDWGVPGVVVSYSDQLPAEMTVEELLTDLDYADTCTDGDVEPLPDGGLIGSYKVWTDCADAKSQVFVAVLTPKETGSSYTRVEIYVPGDADPAIVDQIVGSLSVVIGANGTEAADAGAADTADQPYEYVQIEDPAVVAMIPAEYTEQASEAWTDGDGAVLGNSFTAAPNIEDFKGTWTTPGIIVKSMTGLTEVLDVDDLFDTGLSDFCTYDDRYTEQHTNNGITYNVAYDHYTECDGETSEYYMAIAQSDPPDHFVFVDLLGTGEADRQAFNELLNSFYVNPELQSTTLAGAATDGTDTVQTTNFTPVTDETGVISLSVPESWSDVKSEPWDLGDGSVGPSLTAAPNIEDFDATWETPGVFVAISEELAQDLTPEDALDIFEFEDTCTYDDRYEYTTDALTGYYDVWNECEETKGESFVVLAANPVGKPKPPDFPLRQPDLRGRYGRI
ncbi:MAG: serine protease [Anaerolineales bacterium]|nr:serine protease [Anaerolineales bacterium]